MKTAQKGWTSKIIATIIVLVIQGIYEWISWPSDQRSIILMKYLRIDELEFITDDGMVFGPVGGGGGSPFVSSHPGNF